jgi:hypothetical protein
LITEINREFARPAPDSAEPKQGATARQRSRPAAASDDGDADSVSARGGTPRVIERDPPETPRCGEVNGNLCNEINILWNYISKYQKVWYLCCGYR